MKKLLQGFNIKGFHEITLIDWEGKIASIIFLGGCNLRCGFCHARHLVFADAKTESISFDSIGNFLKAKKEWVDGVVITGGEPTCDEEKLTALIDAVKNIGFDVKLDTNGTRPHVVKRLIESKKVDYIAMDIKAPLRSEPYSMACGVGVEINNIILCKEIIINSGIEHEFRTTAVPGMIDTAGAAEIAKSIRGAKRYRIQQFIPHDTIAPGFLNIKPYTKEKLKEMAMVCAEHVQDVAVRGV